MVISEDYMQKMGRNGTNENRKGRLMEQMNNYRIIWKKRADGSACLLRVYGEFPCIRLPEEIGGVPLTEIAAYCFAPVTHFKAETSDQQADIFEEVVTEDGYSVKNLRELAGNAIEEVEISASVHTIGNCAFYNCRNLKKLYLHGKIDQLGSDAFMNTTAFHQMMLFYSPQTAGGADKILKQITSDLEVVFTEDGQVTAKLLYPEYYESYDEIAPAHIFGRSITGEGFRARQCMKDGKVDLAGYDAVFAQACVEESEQTLSQMALDRLCYPYDLKEEHRQQYSSYVREHSSKIVISLTDKKELSILQELYQKKLIDDRNLAECMKRAAEAGWAEGAAVFLGWQASKRTQRKNRYEF